MLAFDGRHLNAGVFLDLSDMVIKLWEFQSGIAEQHHIDLHTHFKHF